MSAKKAGAGRKRRIPQDVEEYFTRRILVRAALCTAAVVAVTVIFLLGAFESLGTFNEGLLWLIALAACIIFIFKPAELFARSFEGEIVDISVETRMVARNRLGKFGKNTQGLSQAIIKTLLIRLDNGRTLTWEIDFGRFANRSISEPYKVGERVRRIRGSSELYVIGGDSKICVVCGTNNPVDNKKCGFCGHSLLRD